MVWGAFCSRGTLTLAFPSTHMDSAEYQQVLHNNLIPFLRRFRRQHFIFQQDNARIHTSASTMSWFSEKSVEVLEWPACSPDCNPMENLWGIMVRSVYENNRQYNSLQELKTAVLDAWEHLSGETLTKLIDSMPRRIFKVINNNGGLI